MFMAFQEAPGAFQGCSLMFHGVSGHFRDVPVLPQGTLGSSWTGPVLSFRFTESFHRLKWKLSLRSEANDTFWQFRPLTARLIAQSDIPGVFPTVSVVPWNFTEVFMSVPGVFKVFKEC